ncbi:MAG: 3-dehydroquinate synthase [Alphaproteobacteria bacterium]|nr:3-dehydroquinate synthase [Alphaproteobacteria bacterium]
MTQAATIPVTVRVALGARSYDIRVGPGLLAEAGSHLRPLLKEERVFIATDETVAGFHLQALASALDREGIEALPIVLPAGERTKDFTHLELLTGWLLDHRVERGSTLLALGGGVIGDLTGFVASLTLRGIDFVQMPTTLLAQVDSAVGGKTGINTLQGKNLIGSFYQPRLVLSDTATLRTLPQREFLAGYAEVVKYALIRDAEFFTWLEANGPQVLDGQAEALTHAIVKACETKAAVVAADEREAGARALLNLGHTFGHALEAANAFDATLQHGEAVAVGMCLAFELSARLGLCPAADTERVRNHLASVGLPTTLLQAGRGKWEVSTLLQHMQQDKKVSRGRVRFVLARGIGQAFLAEDIATEDVERFLEEAA